MGTSVIKSDEAANTRRSVRRPLIFFALPLVLLLPSWWFFCQYNPGHYSQMSQQIRVQAIRSHWGTFWIVTYFPFAGICFVSSLVMLIRRASYSPGARLALIPVGLFTLGILILIFLIAAQIVIL
jgi:hypothetical protein